MVIRGGENIYPREIEESVGLLSLAEGSGHTPRVTPSAWRWSGAADVGLVK